MFPIFSPWQRIYDGSMRYRCGKAALLLLLGKKELQRSHYFQMVKYWNWRLLKLKRERGVSATVIKDAGDDPDVLMDKVLSQLSGSMTPEICFPQGKVGKVTLPGLGLEEPGTIRAPWKMIERELPALIPRIR